MISLIVLDIHSMPARRMTPEITAAGSRTPLPGQEPLTAQMETQAKQSQCLALYKCPVPAKTRCTQAWGRRKAENRRVGRTGWVRNYG